jgi:hypothetical protein
METAATPVHTNHNSLFRALTWFMGLVSLAISAYLAFHFLATWSRSYIGWLFLAVAQAGVLVTLITMRVEEISQPARDVIVKLYLVVGFLTLAVAWMLKG